MRSARPVRGGCSARRYGAPVSVPGLRSHSRGRPLRNTPASAVQRGGDRLRARALGPIAGDSGCGAASRKPGEGARYCGGERLGELETLGEGGKTARTLSLNAVRGTFGDAPTGRGDRGDSTCGERGTDDAVPAARGARLLRRRARGVMGRAGMRAEKQRPPKWITASHSDNGRQGPRAEGAQGGALKWPQTI